MIQTKKGHNLEVKNPSTGEDLINPQRLKYKMQHEFHSCCIFVANNCEIEIILIRNNGSTVRPLKYINHYIFLNFSYIILNLLIYT